MLPSKGWIVIWLILVLWIQHAFAFEKRIAWLRRSDSRHQICGGYKQALC
jgi:hypothetical protein